jgi:D-alanyl-lipoteichoic acid acyltransferase DltB (MBOAT superfamily)
MGKLQILSLDDHSIKKQRIIRTVAMVMVFTMVLSLMSITAFADGDKITQIAQNIETALKPYVKAIRTVSTILAVVGVSICLLLMLMPGSQKQSDMAGQWMKRILIAWVALLLVTVIINAVGNLANSIDNEAGFTDFTLN